MGRKPADRYHHGDLRASLVEGALRMLREQPPSALSLRAVAKLSGVTPNAPYRHFKDKESLLAAVAEEGFRILARVTSEVTGSGEKRLASMCAAYVEFARSHPNLYRIMFGPDIQHWSEHTTLKETADASLAILVAAIAAAYGLSKERAMTEAVVTWATVHGFATLELDGGARVLSGETSA